MRALTLLVILIQSINCLAQKPIPKDLPKASMIVDTIQIDTSKILPVDELLRLPKALTVTSCQVGIAAKGWTAKIPYEKENYKKNNLLQLPKPVYDFIKPNHGGGYKIFFDEVVVMKGDKIFKLAGKTIFIK